MKRIIFVICSIIVLITYNSTISALAEEIMIENKKVVKQSTFVRNRLGWVERIKIYPENITLEAKLTPGSEGNVLHATNIKELNIKGENWVSFESTDKFGKKINLKRKVKSQRKYITTKGSKVKRYIVDIDFCLDDKYFKYEFALSNRSMFEFPARIGRDALAGQFLIDPGSTKTTKPKCLMKK